LESRARIWVTRPDIRAVQALPGQHLQGVQRLPEWMFNQTEAYGIRVPRHPKRELRRVDQNSDPMRKSCQPRRARVRSPRTVEAIIDRSSETGAEEVNCPRARFPPVSAARVVASSRCAQRFLHNGPLNVLGPGFWVSQSFGRAAVAFGIDSSPKRPIRKSIALRSLAEGRRSCG
jgi:hypothetical protein